MFNIGGKKNLKMTSSFWFIGQWGISQNKPHYGRFSKEDNGFSFGHAELKELTQHCGMCPEHGGIYASKA